MITGKGLSFFVSNEDMNDIIKIIKSLKDLDLLIDGITETLKHEIRKQEGGFLEEAMLAPLATSLVQAVSSSVEDSISARGIRRAVS